MPLAAIAGIGAIGSIAGGLIGAHAAGHAADTQAAAAEQAANLQHMDAQAALDFQKQQYGNSLQMMNPYLQTGYGALNLLRQGLGIGGPTPQGFNPFSIPQQPAAGDGNGVNRADELSILNSLRGGGGSNGFGFRPLNALSAMSGPQGGAGMMNADGSTTQDINPGPFNLQQNPQGGTVQNANGSPGTVAQTGGTQFNMNPPNIPTGEAMGNVGPDGSVASAMTPPGSGLPFGSLLSPFSEKFQAPTNVTEQNDPGYMFRLNQGLDQMTNSAAARGGLLSGGTAKAMQDFAQQDASNEYGNVYNRAMGEYLNRFNIYNTNQTNQFNKLAAISGMGQTSTNELVNAGQGAANNTGSILLNSGAQIGQDLNNAGAARASGYVGQGNAISGAIGGAGNSLNQLLMLRMLLGGGGAGAGGAGV